MQTDCLKGQVGQEMHLKDLLGSIVRVGYHIPVPDFCLVLHGLRCRKSTIMAETKPNSGGESQGVPSSKPCSVRPALFHNTECDVTFFIIGRASLAQLFKIKLD